MDVDAPVVTWRMWTFEWKVHNARNSFLNDANSNTYIYSSQRQQKSKSNCYINRLVHTILGMLAKIATKLVHVDSMSLTKSAKRALEIATDTSDNSFIKTQ